MNRWWTTIIVAMAFCDWYTTWIILVEHKVQHRLSKNTCRTCFQKTNLYSCTAEQWSSLLPTPTCPNCKLNIWETISINNDTKPQMDKWNIHTTDRCNAFLRHYARINLRMHVPKAVLELQPPLEHHLLHLTNADTLPWPHHHQPIELRSREKVRVGEAERREDGEGERSKEQWFTRYPLQLRPPIRL